MADTTSDIELRKWCLEAAINRISKGSRKSAAWGQRNAIDLADEYFHWIKTGKQMERPQYTQASQQAINDYWASLQTTGQLSVVKNG